MSNQQTSESKSHQPPRAGKGFTMVELLVVMLVITMLLTIGVPAVIKFRVQTKIKACQITVNIIDKAVSMYHSEHKRYPSIGSMPAELIGLSYEKLQGASDVTEVDDKNPGTGYRLQDRGTVYGPWNGVDKLKKTGEYDGSTRAYFLDAFNRSIWYCPFKDSTFTDADFTREDSEDGINIPDIAAYAKNEKGQFYRQDYIIMSPSADGKWGLFSDGERPNPKAPPTDDVTNF
jgi:prepilin-type N-terminal cleavage/methylation domain-containing protein